MITTHFRVILIHLSRVSIHQLSCDIQSGILIRLNYWENDLVKVGQIFYDQNTNAQKSDNCFSRVNSCHIPIAIHLNLEINIAKIFVGVQIKVIWLTFTKLLSNQRP